MVVLGFPGSTRQAAALAGRISAPYSAVEVHRFPDGESRVRLPAELPDRAIFYCSLDHPNDKLVELLLAAGAARELGVRHLTLVAPYLCYMRQDKAFHPGEAVSQRIVGMFLAGQVDKLVTVDPHLHRVATLAEAVPARETLTLSAAAQMGGFVKRGEIADAYEHILKPVPFLYGIMDIIGGHATEIKVASQGGQAGDQYLVVGQKMVLELNPVLFVTEEIEKMTGDGHGGGAVTAGQ